MNKQKVILLISLAIAVKLIMMLAFLYTASPSDFANFKFYNEHGGDAPDYIEPVENLVAGRGYYFGIDNYAGRMPGYAVVYLPLRLLFSKHIALNLVILLQIILSGLSVFVLAYIAYKETISIKVFYALYIVYLICTYVSFWDGANLTESFATSAFIFSLFFFQKALKTQNYFHFALTGIFFTWCVFLRPYMLPIYALFVLIPAYKMYISGKSIKEIFFIALLTCLPFFITDGLWVIRNYKFENKIILLQRTPYKGYNLEGRHKALIHFIKSFGGARMAWSPNSHAAWFATDDYLDTYGFKRPADDIFPKKIFSDNLTIDTLKLARDYYVNIEKSKKNISPSIYFHEELTVEVAEVTRILNKFKENFVKNYPFDYYVLVPVKYFLNLTFLQAYTYYLPYDFSKASLTGKLFKVFTFMLNYMIMALGIMSFLLLLFSAKTNSVTTNLLIFSLFYLLLFFPLGRRNDEYRMLTLCFPVFIYLMSMLYFRILKFFTKSNLNN